MSSSGSFLRQSVCPMFAALRRRRSWKVEEYRLRKLGQDSKVGPRVRSRPAFALAGAGRTVFCLGSWVRSGPRRRPGRDQFHAIAMQAVGSALTGGHGGLGIAAMVAKHLEAQAAHKDAANCIGNKRLTSGPHFDQTIGYPKGDKMIIGLKFFLELPIKLLRGIAGAADEDRP